MKPLDFRGYADAMAPLVGKIYTNADFDGMAGAGTRANLLVLLKHDREAWMPKRVPSAPTSLSQALSGYSADKLADAVQRLPMQILKQLCSHREQVTYLESRNAQKLLVLASAVRSAANAPRLDETVVAVEVADFIAEHWRCDVPETGDLRAWSSRSTRAYSALPRHWRELDMPAVVSKKNDEQ